KTFKSGCMIMDKTKAKAVRPTDPTFYLNDADKRNQRRQVAFAKFLQLHKARLPRFTHFICEPNPDVACREPRAFNLYKGFKAQRVPVVNRRLIDPFLRHYRDVLCAGDDAVFRYHLAWWNRVCATPWIKTKVALYFYSEKEQSGGQ